MFVLGVAGGLRHFIDYDELCRCLLRAALRHPIFFSVLPVFIGNDNASALGLSAHRYQFRRINDVRQSNYQSNACGNVCLIGRRGRVQVLLRFIRSKAGTFLGLSTMLNANGGHDRVRYGRALIGRGAKRLFLCGAGYRAFRCNQFSSSQFASRGKIVLLATAWCLYRTLSFPLASRREIGAAFLNNLDRVDAGVVGRQDVVDQLPKNDLHLLLAFAKSVKQAKLVRLFFIVVVFYGSRTNASVQLWKRLFRCLLMVRVVHFGGHYYRVVLVFGSNRRCVFHVYGLAFRRSYFWGA